MGDDAPKPLSAWGVVFVSLTGERSLLALVESRDRLTPETEQFKHVRLVEESALEQERAALRIEVERLRKLVGPDLDVRWQLLVKDHELERRRRQALEARNRRLYDSLKELVDKRTAEAKKRGMEADRWFDGSDGRYKRARKALEDLKGPEAVDDLGG